MEVDLQREARRGRQAEEEVSLVEEHLRERQSKLFDRFCDPLSDDEVYVIREEARALQRVRDFLKDTVITGQLAERQLGEERERI